MRVLAEAGAGGHAPFPAVVRTESSWREEQAAAASVRQYQ